MEYLLLLLGAIAYLLFNLNKEIKLETFSWQHFFLNQGIAACLNVVLGVIFILSKTTVGDEFGVIRFAIFGFAAQTFWMNIIEALDVKVKTKIGVNRK